MDRTKILDNLFWVDLGEAEAKGKPLYVNKKVGSVLPANPYCGVEIRISPGLTSDFWFRLGQAKGKGESIELDPVQFRDILCTHEFARKEYGDETPILGTYDTVPLVKIKEW